MKATLETTDSMDVALAEKLNLIRRQQKLPIKRIVMLWMPCLFTAFIAAITLAPTFMKVDNGLPVALIPLLCFLPMAFFFSAQATFNEISSLEARIKELEKNKPTGQST
jgi:hypothetical protein